MMWYITAEILVAWLLCAGAVVGERVGYKIKERHHVPRRWTRFGPAPAKHPIQLQIGLKQGRFGDLERHLFEGWC